MPTCFVLPTYLNSCCNIGLKRGIYRKNISNHVVPNLIKGERFVRYEDDVIDVLIWPQYQQNNTSKMIQVNFKF